MKVVELLLDEGADANARVGRFGNALYAASFNGHEKVVELLVDRRQGRRRQHATGSVRLFLAVFLSGHEITDTERPLLLIVVNNLAWHINQSLHILRIHIFVHRCKVTSPIEVGKPARPFGILST